jgi:hypothetical protein
MICAYCNTFKVHSFYRLNYCTKTCLELAMLRRKKEALITIEKDKRLNEAHTVMAKAAIIKRNKDPRLLTDFAQKVSFRFGTTNELTVYNRRFVNAIARYIANLL